MDPVLLLVDDDPMHIKIAKESLEYLEFEISAVKNGTKAKEFCEKTMPDIIILDWMMPEYDGVEFAKDLRAMENGDKPYIIMCTAKGRKGNMAIALAAGADTFLTKPFDPETLELLLLEANLIKHEEF